MALVPTKKRPAASLALALVPAKKRPAAWHDDDDEVTVVKKASGAAVGINDPAELSGEDGDLDDRTTSRAQRWVFTQHISGLDEATQKRWAELNDPNSKIAQKTKLKNQLINTFVPRHTDWKGTIQPKVMSVTELKRMTWTDTEIHTNKGLPELVMIGKTFAGHRNLFNEALATGEVYQNEDGLYYYKESSTSKAMSSSTRMEGKKVHETADDKTYLSVLSELLNTEATKSEQWLTYKPVGANKKTTPAAIKTDPASQADFSMLQESFDSVTRVTTAIKRVALELMNLNPTSAAGASQMAARGISLCKHVVPSQETVETLLLSERGQVTTLMIKDAMKEAAKPDRELVDFYNELVALHKHHSVKEKGTSSSSAKFRTIEA